LSGLLVKGFNLQDEKLPGKDRNLLVDHFLIFYHQQILFLISNDPHSPNTIDTYFYNYYIVN